MDLIRLSIKEPVAVLVGVILVVMFGLVALYRIPYQLTPNVEVPVVSVRTAWPGATPYEIERDVIEEQENVLKGIPGLNEMESTSSNSFGEVTLRFNLGTNINEALLRVSNKLDEVPRYPENVFKPVVSSSSEQGQVAVYVALKALDSSKLNVTEYRTYFENEVRQYLERVPGVASVIVNGGQEQQMQVLIKPDKLAAYGLTIDEVINALRGDNVNVSAGTLNVGRREFRVRAVSEFRSVEDIQNVVVASDGQRRVLLADLADVQFGFSKLAFPGLQDGEPGIVIPIRPEPGANVLELTNDVEAAVDQLNKGKLADDGLYLQWLTDQRQYINGAIALLKSNIVQGGLLTVAVLLLFLRSAASTLIIMTIIPISMIGTFIVMEIVGSTLNIISMAGIAFAVGILIDNGIVVLENIHTHRALGKSPFQASYDGAREVWGAIFASTVTNVAVFLPVIFLKQEAGQLFRDIAIAATVSVSISLVAAVTVIPMLSRLLFEAKTISRIEDRIAHFPLFDRIGGGLGNAFMLVVRAAMHNAFTRIATVTVLTASAVIVTYLLFPKMEYLPEGNRDLIFNTMIPPPGLSYEERLAIGKYIYEYLEPYYEPGYEGYPGIKRVFFMSPGSMMMCGIVSKDPQRTKELIPLSRKMMATIPGIIGVSNQAGLFSRGRGGGSSRNIEVNISGRGIEEMVEVARRMMGNIRDALPDAQIRPEPSLDLMYPEAQFVPNGEALRAVGMTAQQFGIALDVIMDGRDIGDFKQEGEKKIDLVVKVADTLIETPEDLNSALLPTPGGTTVPVSSLARLEHTTGMTAIRHMERDRTFTLMVTPPTDITIQEAMEIVEQKVVPEMEAQGLLENMRVSLSGTADALTETRLALQWNFLLAAAITYLLMAALYGNFIYPLIIMFTVPLAGAGGLIGLKLVNYFIAPQPLDILTMLGFIILVGVVVNNAILIVHQSLNNVRIDGMNHYDAVLDATRSRLRPIYMTATASVIGMLPMVIWPGPGSELYRGLGSVVLGGLALSTIFTVFLIPALLLFFIRMEPLKPKAIVAMPDVPIGEPVDDEASLALID